MSLDRFGVPVLIGWPAHHIVYLEAALSLPRSERAQAFEDIASLTGRDFAAVRDKAYKIERARLLALVAPYRVVMVPGRAVPCPQRSRYLGSELNLPTKAQKMGRR